MIKHHIENDCVGCPQGCIHCGRKNGYYVLDDLVCDECKESSDVLYSYDDEQLCLGCLLKEVDVEEINDDNFADYMPEFEPDIDEEDY